MVGRICCDSNGRLNAQSVVMEGSVETSSGKQAGVHLGNVSEYSLFPGQVVAMEGSNTSGRKFVATKVYEVCCCEELYLGLTNLIATIQILPILKSQSVRGTNKNRILCIYRARNERIMTA